MYNMCFNPTNAENVGKWVFMKCMPTISGFIKKRSIFTQLIQHEISPTRLSVLSRLMSPYVDVKKQLLPLLTMKIIYTREHGRKYILLDCKTIMSKTSPWVRRVGFIKKSVLSSNILLGTLLKSTNTTNIS